MVFARIFLCRACVALVLLLGLSVTAKAAPSYSYVGSFNVFDGPAFSFDDPPQALSARQAAALIFGGSFSDYAISIVYSRNPDEITHTAWLDGVFDTQYLETPADEDFIGASTTGKYDEYGVYSAWVCDHADCLAAGFDASEGWSGYNYTNYVWRLSNPTIGLPETSTPALLFAGLLLLGYTQSRRRRV